MRAVTEEIYGIPPERVIGSSNALRYAGGRRRRHDRLPGRARRLRRRPGQAGADLEPHRPAADRRGRQLERRHPDAAVRGRAGPAGAAPAGRCTTTPSASSTTPPVPTRRWRWPPPRAGRWSASSATGRPCSPTRRRDRSARARAERWRSPRGLLQDGVRPALRRGGARAPGGGRRLLDRPVPVTNAQFGASSAATARDGGGAPLAAADIRRAAGEPRAGCSSSGAPQASRPAAPELWWAWTPAPAGDGRDGPGSTVEGVERRRSCAWPRTRESAAGPAPRCPRRPSGSCARGGSREQRTPGARNPRAGRAARALLARRVLVPAGRGYGASRRSAVFPANGTGLRDMAGDVWEWTADWYASTHVAADSPGCGAQPRGRRRRRVWTRPSRSSRAPQGAEGRQLPLRRLLLPALPPGRPAAADGRHGHEPHRHALCRAAAGLAPAQSNSGFAGTSASSNWASSSAGIVYVCSSAGKAPDRTSAA